MNTIEYALNFLVIAFLFYLYYMISKDFLAKLDKWRRIGCVLVISAFVFYVDAKISSNSQEYIDEIRSMVLDVQTDYSYNEDLSYDLNSILEYIDYDYE